MLNWDDAKEKGIYPTKFFEYLSAHRPILATGGYEGDDVQAMIARTQSGVYAITENEIEQALLTFVEEFKKTGKVFYQGNSDEIKKYSYNKLAEQLSEIMQKVIV
jgi:hypothetical protein